MNHNFCKSMEAYMVWTTLPISCATMASNALERNFIMKFWLTDPFGLAQIMKKTMIQKINPALWIAWCENLCVIQMLVPSQSFKEIHITVMSIHHGMDGDVITEILHALK